MEVGAECPGRQEPALMTIPPPLHQSWRGPPSREGAEGGPKAEGEELQWERELSEPLPSRSCINLHIGSN